MPSRGSRRRIFAAAGMLLASTILHAQVQPISQMFHASWSGREGAPQAIQAMAQTPDGILWIASVGGLFTFDGVSFRPYRGIYHSDRFFTQFFHYLFVSKSGDLWMFGWHGAPGRLHGGRLQIFDRVEWPYLEELKFPQEGSDGKLWSILNERQLVWLTPDGAWRPAPCPKNGDGDITMLFIDSADTMWLVVNNRVYRRALHDADFQATSVYAFGDIGFKEGPAHDLWIASSAAHTTKHPFLHLQHIDRNGRTLTSPTVDEPVTGALPMPDGSLWVLTGENNLLHLDSKELAAGGLLKVSAYADKTHVRAGAELSESPAFLRASDGSLWIGGMGGVEQFAISTLVPAIVNAPVGVWHSCVDHQGTLWINDPHGLLYRGAHGFNSDVRLQGVANIFCSPRGGITLNDQEGLAVLQNDHLHRLPPIPGLRPYIDHYMVTGNIQMRDGSILAVVAGRVIGRYLWLFRDGKWSPYLAGQKMPEVSAIYSDRTGRSLLGFRGSNNIGVIESNRLHEVSTTKPGITTTLGFVETSYGLLAYGRDGIALEAGTQFRMLSFANPDHVSFVTGVVESQSGDLWLASSVGIVRVAAQEIRHALADLSYRPISNEIREGGAAGPSFPELFSNTASKDLSGRLWFATLNGVVSADPSVGVSAPPLLSIRSINADSQSMSAKATFPPDIRVLTIDYIGVDFTNPKHVSYRYRLDGYDTAWQDAGSRTEAIYTYLGPGKYRFEVMAQNAYGIWTAPVISAPFVVLPRFYQQHWFQILCALLLAALLWLIVRTRLKSVETAIRLRAEERADERISIARDLHDTLLQGVQGLSLTFHAAAERVPEDHESKRALEKALATADKIIVEGRDRVKGLRDQDLGGKDLCFALRALGDDLNVSGEIEYLVSCADSDFSLIPHVASEIFLIAREAVMNAFRHAQASRILVSVEYGRRRFHLECRDNGSGLTRNARDVATKHEHWGIQGMSERAEKLGATFAMQTKPGEGTSVEITMKAKRAYE